MQIIIIFPCSDKPQCLHSGPVTVALSEDNKETNLVICDTEAVPRARSVRWVMVYMCRRDMICAR